MTYFIQDNNSIYVFHGVSDDANFNSFYRIFESTMTNFSRLTDQAKLNVKPKRIKIIQAPASGTLSQTFKSLKVPDSQMKELTLLNNMELTDQIAKGKLIKIIGE
jgi:predicted Zn-dependent protease